LNRPGDHARTTRVYVLQREQILDGAPEDVFPFFADAQNLETITPPWLRFEVTKPPQTMREGALIEYRLTLHRIPVRWRTRIEEWAPPYRFVDVQLKGPYALWHHTHEFARHGGGQTVMRDTVRYALPLGPLGRLAHSLFVKRDLDRIFDYQTVSLPSMPSARWSPTGQ
jgi:ligand-binding SRPBCC domain-containing protein